MSAGEAAVSFASSSGSGILQSDPTDGRQTLFAGGSRRRLEKLARSAAESSSACSSSMHARGLLLPAFGAPGVPILLVTFRAGPSQLLFPDKRELEVEDEGVDGSAG